VPVTPARTERVERIVILGAAGRDFHNFNVVYRDDPATTVVAFTATQIPGIADRTYPAALAGPRYPRGIPIRDESDLEAICRRAHVTQVVFGYSDVTHGHVMRLAARALGVGANFVLLGPDRTMLDAKVPVVAVCAVRTGCGKTPIARWLGRYLRAQGRRVAIVRHPMPYGDLERQRSQRFASLADVDAAGCTVEEREEYEPHLAAGNAVFAGVDYADIARRAAAEADLLVWDGGNNDFPFFRPSLLVVVADALRPEDAAGYHPGEAVLRMADVIVLNKVDVATTAQVTRAIEVIRTVNATAPLVLAASPVQLDDAAAIRGRRVLIVEDGPTLTHGSMAHGAGFVAARAAGATIVDPRPGAGPEILDLLARYPHIGPVLPALGYTQRQLDILKDTIDRAPSTSSSRRRPSTWPASSHRTSPWCAHATSSPRRENRGSRTSSTTGSPGGQQLDARERPRLERPAAALSPALCAPPPVRRPCLTGLGPRRIPVATMPRCTDVAGPEPPHPVAASRTCIDRFQKGSGSDVATPPRTARKVRGIPMHKTIEAKTVREVMTPNPITVTADTTIRDLLTMFETHDFNMLPVVDGRGVLLGLVTKLDLLRVFRLQLRHWIPDLRFFWAERVEDIMSRGAVDVAPDDPVLVAIDTMIDARVRSLPVVERRREGRFLIGIVSRTDVLPCLIMQRDEAPSALSGPPGP
jgi:predicted GTPase/CBS domain-containing protein